MQKDPLIIELTTVSQSCRPNRRFGVNRCPGLPFLHLVLSSVLPDVELLAVDSTKASCWFNNKLRAHEEQWKEDDCTFCQCVDSEPHCTAMACKQSCQNPVKIPGECCPFCEGTESWDWGGGGVDVRDQRTSQEARPSPRFCCRGRVSMGSLKGGRRAFLEPRAPLCAFITVARQNETHL